MLLITCPFCGNRPEIEFRNGGEAHIVRPENPSVIEDGAWADYLFFRTNTKGVYAERWNHANGCGRWFNALRDTTTDKFIITYKAGEVRPVVQESNQ